MRIYIRLLFLSLGSFPLLDANADQLPSLWPAPAAKLDKSIKPPYAFVARPYFGERFNGVDVVTLDPMTMKPLSRSPTALRCDRVHSTPYGELLCFSNSVPGKVASFSNPTSYFYSRDLSFVVKHENETNGRPSRARISADGKFGATTEFVNGHSYIATSSELFSTSTVIVQRGSEVDWAEDIQKWPVLFGKSRVTSLDLNLWGVTFDPTNSHIFYVTAYFDGKPYLAQGDVITKRIVVLKAGVECPSYSPDGKRLAFKKRTSMAGWSPATIELSDMKERVYEVSESVDDQIEWLDDQTLVYEVIKRPLIGLAVSNLMKLDLREKVPQEQLWLDRARSVTFIRE